jgi:hypothetical protein
VHTRSLPANCRSVVDLSPPAPQAAGSQTGRLVIRNVYKGRGQIAGKEARYYEGQLGVGC